MNYVVNFKIEFKCVLEIKESDNVHFQIRKWCKNKITQNENWCKLSERELLTLSVSSKFTKKEHSFLLIWATMKDKLTNSLALIC